MERLYVRFDEMVGKYTPCIDCKLKECLITQRKKTREYENNEYVALVQMNLLRNTLSAKMKTSYLSQLLYLCRHIIQAFMFNANIDRIF